MADVLITSGQIKQTQTGANAKASIDAKYGPYIDLDDALSKLTPTNTMGTKLNYLTPGLTIGVYTDNTKLKVVEYIVEGDVTSQDITTEIFKLKQTDISGKADASSVYTKTEVDNALSNKINKVTEATANNFAALDGNGNLKDSGKKSTDFVQMPTGGSNGLSLKKTSNGVEWGNISYENNVSDKPTINSVTLSLNKTASDLGLATAAQGTKADNAIPMPSDGIDGQILEKDSTVTGGVKWSPKPSNGASAYELYIEEYKTAHSGDATGAMTEAEWLASLKAQFGSFVPAEYGTDGEPNDGSTDIPASADTTNHIYLVDDNPDTPTAKVMWITVVDETNPQSPVYTWTSIGTVNVNLKFDSGESINNIKIDNTQLVNPADNALAKAEDIHNELFTDIAFDITGSVESSGGFSSVNNGRRTDYIKVYEGIKVSAYDGGTQYTGYRACGFYRRDKSFISCLEYTSAGQKTFTLTSENIPAEAYYIVCSTLTDNLSQSYIEYHKIGYIEQNLENNISDTEKVTNDFNDAFVSKSVEEKSYSYTVNSGSKLNKTYILTDCIGMFVEVRVDYEGTANTFFSLNCAASGGTTVSTFVGIPFSKNIRFKITNNNCRVQIYTSNNETESSSYRVTIIPFPYYGLEDLKDLVMKNEIDYTEDLIADKYYSTNLSTIDTSPSTLSGCKCYKGEISGGDILHICGKSSSNIVGLFAFYDSSLVKIYNVQNSTYQKELFVEAPSNAAYFVFNCVNFDATKHFVKVQKTFSIEEMRTDIADLQEVRSLMWKDKTVVCFGDSITEFTNSLGKSYTDYISEITGANVINVGIGGTHIRKLRDPVTVPISNVNHAFAAMDIASLIESVCSGDFTIPRAGAQWRYDYNGDDNRPTVERLAAIDFTKVDIVTIFAGVNDWSGAATLGTSESTDVTTVNGAINYIIQSLLSTYPQIKLYWFTPIVHWEAVADRTPENWGDNEVKGGVTLEQFVEAIKSQVYLYKIPTCDMYHTLGWNQYNFNNYFRTTDGTHPYKGFYQIGRKFVSFINSNRTF